MTGLWAVLALVQAPVDEGRLVVRRDTQEIAREQFQLVASPRTSGWTLAAKSRYAGAAQLDPILELGHDSLPRTLQYDVVDARESLRILGQAGRGRFTLRYVSRSAERAREFPDRGLIVVLDDSVYSFYTVVGWFARPGAGPTTLTAVVPRGARLETVQVEDHGIEATTLNRDRAMLRHITVSGRASGTVHVWLDTLGHLMKVENPAARLTAERLPGN